jgi:RNA polymerase sigma-70 factor (ECF subfamily)
MRKYGRLIITICTSYTGNYFDAEDISQQVFLTVYKNMHKFHGGNLKAWLVKIAINKCKDYVKSPARDIQNLELEDYNSIKDSSILPLETLEIKYSTEQVYNLCRKLKDPYKTVAVNYFCKDMKLSDMAKQTGENLKTLQTRLYRAKKLLKVLWKEEFT